MKKITILLLLLNSIAYFSFGQQTTTNAPKVKTDYLQKSKNQKKTAWIMLGGGAALFITGLVIPRGDLTDQFDLYTWTDIYENDDIKGGFMLAGTLSMLGSVPFFIASGKNKKRAASMSFKFQHLPQMQNGNLTRLQVPSLSFKVNL